MLRQQSKRSCSRTRAPVWNHFLAPARRRLLLYGPNLKPRPLHQHYLRLATTARASSIFASRTIPRKPGFIFGWRRYQPWWGGIKSFYFSAACVEEELGGSEHLLQRIGHFFKQSTDKTALARLLRTRVAHASWAKNSSLTAAANPDWISWRLHQCITDTSTIKKSIKEKQILNTYMHYIFQAESKTIFFKFTCKIDQQKTENG